MKFTTFMCMCLTLIAVKIVQIQGSAQDDTLDEFMRDKDLENPTWKGFSSGILSARFLRPYSSNFDKTVLLKAPQGFVILVAVRLLDLRPNNVDSLTLFVKGDDKVKKVYTNPHFTQNRWEDPDEIKDLFFVHNGQLGVTFKTGPGSTDNYDGFKLVYTVQANATCHNDEYFVCKNHRCINKGLKCDGHNNCGDRSDETNCVIIPDPKATIVIPDIPDIFIKETKDLQATAGKIAAIVCGVVFSLLIIGGLIAFLIIRKASARSRTQGAVVTNRGY